MNPRLQTLRNQMVGLKLEGMIVSNPINIKYLTNLDAEGILLVTRKENIFITDGRYIEEVNNIIKIEDEIIISNVSDISLYDYEDFFMFCENVGFEEDYVTYAKYKEIMHKYKINNLVETEGLIEKQRLVKSEEEIEEIIKACEITDKCFEYIINYIKKGMTEKQIAREMENFMLNEGANGLAFETIVASGENSSKPHATPTDRVITSGDVILLDFGCKYNGYCSDMSRTIFVDFIQDDVKKVYDLILESKTDIENQIKSGAECRKLFKTVENRFKFEGYNLIHALGHGVGLYVHEEPTIGTRNDRFLKENMIITNEPGIYIPGKFGIRIEDTILVNKTDCELLTKSNRDYIVI